MGVRSLRTQTRIFPMEIFQWCLWGTVIFGGAIASNAVLQDGIRLGLFSRGVVALVVEKAITDIVVGKMSKVVFLW